MEMLILSVTAFTDFTIQKSSAEQVQPMIV